jgi:hypothetical protein
MVLTAFSLARVVASYRDLPLVNPTASLSAILINLVGESYTLNLSS